MSKNRKNLPTSTSNKSTIDLLIAKYGLLGTVMVALIGVIGTTITAYFGFLGIQTQLERPIKATQTAEVRLTQISLLSTVTKPPSNSGTPSTIPTTTSTPTLTAMTGPDTSYLKLEYGDPFVKRSYTPRGYFLLMLPGRPAGKSQPQIDFDQGISLPTGNRLTVTITNVSDKTVLLSNKVPLEIDHSASDLTLHVWLVSGGGAGYYRNFVADIPRDEKHQIVLAQFEEFGQIENKALIDPPDFFTLAPGEVEVFEIEVRLQDPGEYTLRPGVEFTVGGEPPTVMWLTQPVIAFMPRDIIVWGMSDDYSTYEEKGECILNNSTGVLPDLYDMEYLKTVYICDF